MIGKDTTRRAKQAGVLALLSCGLGLAVSAGCTRESLRIALEAQRRADQVQHAVFERQHEALRILLYRDLLKRLEQAGEPLAPEQHAVVNDVWNERDLLEFWTVQHERARALRLMGVDAKLASDQAIVDLLIKAVEAKLNRIEDEVARQVGHAVLEGPPPESQAHSDDGASPAAEPGTPSGSPH